jgi:hypothetical protein
MTNIYHPNKRIVSSEPRVRIFDILVFLDSLGASFTSKVVRESFDITIEDACMRLKHLREFGMIKMIKKKRPKQYVVTEWGKKFLIDQGYIENTD